jgi:hypothetical protein
MEWSHSPHTQVGEGAYAIKVSMKFEDDEAWNLYRRVRARTTACLHLLV